jgi:uncharacterized membrane protein
MSNKAKNKRDKVLKGNKKFEFRWEWLIPIIILIVGIAFVVWPRNEEGKLRLGSASAHYKLVKAQDGVVSIPVSTFGDYRAKYYEYKFPEKTVSFFILKSSDGVIRAAFDACDVCFREKKGYRQEGDLMVCNNCGQLFPSERINIEKGGCNPAPLERSTVGQNVVLKVSDIYLGVRYF